MAAKPSLEKIRASVLKDIEKVSARVKKAKTLVALERATWGVETSGRTEKLFNSSLLEEEN